MSVTIWTAPANWPAASRSGSTMTSTQPSGVCSSVLSWCRLCRARSMGHSAIGSVPPWTISQQCLPRISQQGRWNEVSAALFERRTRRSLSRIQTASPMASKVFCHSCAMRATAASACRRSVNSCSSCWVRSATNAANCSFSNRCRRLALLILAMARICATSSSSSRGLVRKASAPASRALTRLSRSARPAVRKTTGIELSPGSAFSRRQTSKPSMPGITMSSRITSGSALRASPIPSGPFRAVSTSHPGRASPTTARRVVRLSALSSMASSFIEPPSPAVPAVPSAAGRHRPVWRGSRRNHGPGWSPGHPSWRWR